LVVVWAALAVHYSNLPWPWMREVLALSVVALGIWALWLTRDRRAFWGFATVLGVVLIWWTFIPARQDRAWRPEVAVPARAEFLEGDRVRLTGVRHFDYRTRTDFTVRREERIVDLAHLVAVDFFVSYWSSDAIAHTFVSFVFDNAPPVCISIEARLEQTERYRAVASLFKQFELVYVVGDERDIIRVRTHHRAEQVYRYRTIATPAGARQLFLSYLAKVNELAEKPEFYHLLSNNCTVNIDRHAHPADRRSPFDPRLLLNGYADRFAYEKGLFAGEAPFPELRARANITAAALAVPDGGVNDPEDPDFSRRIREAAGR
jgi:hypothetical protein